eukprot:1151602-Pelagomonas_calceolata.AAC.5
MLLAVSEKHADPQQTLHHIMWSARLGNARIRFSVGTGKGSRKGGGRMSISTMAAINAGRPIIDAHSPAATKNTTANTEAVGSCQVSSACRRSAEVARESRIFWICVCGSV